MFCLSFLHVFGLIKDKGAVIKTTFEVIVSSVLCMNLFLSQKLTIFEGTENKKDEFCQTRWFQWLFS